MPRDESGVELEGILHAEVGELRADPRLVDDAVSDMTSGQGNVRFEGRLDELGFGRPPTDPGQDADMAALYEPETPRAACDLGEFPGQEVAALLPVELRRLREEERLAGEVDPMAEDIGRDADVRGAREKALDLLTSRRERHRAVEDGDPAGVDAVHLTCKREHGAPAERNDDSPGRERPEGSSSDELERQLALEDLQLVPWERAIDEWERIDRSQNEDLAVLAREEETRPRRATLGVVGPLDLVENEELSGVRRHLDRRADDRRTLVDPLFSSDEPYVLGADPVTQAPVRLLREHPQRPGIDARALVRELPQSRMGLPRVRRPEVRDDTLGLDTSRRERDRDPLLGRAHDVGGTAPRALGTA